MQLKPILYMKMMVLVKYFKYLDIIIILLFEKNSKNN